MLSVVEDRRILVFELHMWEGNLHGGEYKSLEIYFNLSP